MKKLALAIALSLLSAPLALAQDSGCYMRTTDGRTISMGKLCNNSEGATRGANTTPQTSAPIYVSNVRIKRAVTPDFIKITGFVVNQTNEAQKVNWMEYQLLDRASNKVVAISSAFVAKTIPALGKVGFETLIDRKDVNGVPPSRLVLQITSIN